MIVDKEHQSEIIKENHQEGVIMNQYHAIPLASTFGHVETTPSGEVLLTPGNFRDLRLYLSPAKARDLARILTEAADHIENHQNT